jgi:hypothetical protein
MITVIGDSGFIGTRLSRSEKEFQIVDKVESKSFAAICKIADVRDTEPLSKVLYR